MKVTKEWNSVVEKIYKLIGINGLMSLDLTIPSLLFTEYGPEYQERQNIKLSYLYIKLEATSYCSGEKVSNTIKIKFGPKEHIDEKNKKITIEFKYASKIVLYLIHLFAPYNLSIKTDNLKDRNGLFSPSISTLDDTN